MFAEDISEDFSEDRRYHFLLDFKVFLDIFEIFAEDCFLLRSFRKFLPSGFLPLSRFQNFGDDPLKLPRISVMCSPQRQLSEDLKKKGSREVLLLGTFCLGRCPVLPFLVFFWKTARKTTQKTRIFYPCRIPKIPGKEGKNAQKKKSRNSKKTGEKNKEFQKKNKERKDSAAA